MIEIIIILILLAFIYYQYKKIKNIETALKENETKIKSTQVRYGKMSEQFFPFLDKYPYDKNNFRFLGSPIDGVQFEDDEIIFVEFKTGKSRLSNKQSLIKNIIEKGKIKFKEFRI